MQEDNSRSVHPEPGNKSVHLRWFACFFYVASSGSCEASPRPCNPHQTLSLIGSSNGLFHVCRDWYGVLRISLRYGVYLRLRRKCPENRQTRAGLDTASRAALHGETISRQSNIPSEYPYSILRRRPHDNHGPSHRRNHSHGHSNKVGTNNPNSAILPTTPTIAPLAHPPRSTDPHPPRRANLSLRTQVQRSQRADMAVAAGGV